MKPTLFFLKGICSFFCSLFFLVFREALAFNLHPNNLNFSILPFWCLSAKRVSNTCAAHVTVGIGNEAAVLRSIACQPSSPPAGCWWWRRLKLQVWLTPLPLVL